MSSLKTKISSEGDLKVVFSTKSDIPDRTHYTSIDMSDQHKNGECTCTYFLADNTCDHLQKLKDGDISILADNTQKDLLQIVLNFN